MKALGSLRLWGGGGAADVLVAPALAFSVGTALFPQTFAKTFLGLSASRRKARPSFCPFALSLHLCLLSCGPAVCRGQLQRYE